MNLTSLLSFVRLEVLVGLSGLVTIVTQLIREAPVEWTTDNGKKIAFLVSATLIAFIGYRQGTDIAVMVPIVPVVAWISMGLYDTFKNAYIWLRTKIS